MVETVYEINVGLKGISIDKKRNAIVFKNINNSGNSSVDLIGRLTTLLAKIANSKNSPVEARKKKAGFKLDATKFSVAALEDHTQVNYDFSDSEPDLIHSLKDIVCEVLDLHLAGISKSIKQLNEVDQPASASYSVSGFSNINDAYEAVKILNEIAKNEDATEFDIKVEGNKNPHNINILGEPEKPEFSPETEERFFLEFEISDAHKKEPSIEIAPKSGKGKKKIIVNAEQYSALHNSNGFSIDSYELYDFKVKQLKANLYELISFTPSSCQMELPS
ncbi:hypothetical protein [Marinomonas primoryensis]|jgi:hypothetical protein|uniref:Uncharacterized protein n=1 Tax=Marinomonas primoryensis TaxID=178399 RepID=A0A859CV69_9GAMM|nr:hypothetical protein [Marinomonas primoryensis]QKK80354.1 uncharacterized protein MP3633_1625 [Marinomonas primoryensis]